MYVFDSLGGLKLEVNMKNTQVFDIKCNDNNVYYISDLGVYQLKPVHEEKLHFYGFKRFDFTDDYFILGTLYHAIVKYNNTFNFTTKTGGIKTNLDIDSNYIYIKNNTIYVGTNTSIYVFTEHLKIKNIISLPSFTFTINTHPINYNGKDIQILNSNFNVISSINMSGIKELLTYKNTTYVLINNSIYRLEIVEYKEEKKEEAIINTTLNKTIDENITTNVDKPKENKSTTIKKEEKTINNKTPMTYLIVSLILLFLLIILFLIFTLIKHNKKRYRRKKK